jgi:hypothetical protein
MIVACHQECAWLNALQSFAARRWAQILTLIDVDPHKNTMRLLYVVPYIEISTSWG